MHNDRYAEWLKYICVCALHDLSTLSITQYVYALISDAMQCSAKVTRAAGPTQCVLSLKGSVGRVQSTASSLTMLHTLFLQPGTLRCTQSSHTVCSVTWWNVEHYASEHSV